MAAPGRSIADRAYDADGPRRWLAVRGIEAAILSTATRTVPDPLGRRACARHKSVERLYCRAKNRHRLATR